MSSISNQIEAQAFPLKVEISDILRDCRELLKEKAIVSAKIQDYKQSLRKAK